MIAAAAASSTPEALLTAPDAARLLRVSISWLAKARLTGTGPRFVKIGRSVRYPESFIREYIKVRTRSSTSER
jgi:predicted DNA-binding transcriptional regulator AlpA